VSWQRCRARGAERNRDDLSDATRTEAEALAVVADEFAARTIVIRLALDRQARRASLTVPDNRATANSPPEVSGGEAARNRTTKDERSSWPPGRPPTDPDNPDSPPEVGFISRDRLPTPPAPVHHSRAASVPAVRPQRR
jgi:hypothetical protein